MGGRDGMDCNRRVWMTLPFWEASPELMPWAPPRCWACLAGVSGYKKTYLRSSIIKKIYPAISAAIGGRDGMDLQQAHLDDVF